MAGRAVDVLRQILESKDTPASVRLRAALAVLGSMGGIQALEVGDIDAGDVDHAWSMKQQRQLKEIKRTLDF